MKTRSLLILTIAAGLIYFVYLAHRGSGSAIGAKAFDFSLPTKTAAVRLSDFRGRWVLLNFWASWCPPCVAEMPSLEALKDKMEGPDFKVLAVSVDEDGWSAVDRFMARVPITMTVLIDARGDVASAYGVFELPQTFLIDREGRIRREYQGPKDWMSPEVLAEMERYVRGS